MNQPLVLIVGAGPTGMTLAIELRRAGVDVRIIDKSPHPALHSQALVVQARTLEQMQRYGVALKAVSEGRQLTQAKMWSEGKQLMTFRFDKIPSRYPFLLFLPQNKTEAILNETMESLGVKVERQTELITFRQRQDGNPQANGVNAELRLADGSQESLEARWIIGCDGAHSVVREMAAIPFEGGGVGLSFFLGDLEIEGPDTPDDELSIHLHQGDVVFMGRLSDKFVRIIVALHDAQPQQDHRELSIQDFQNAIDRAGVRVKVLSSDWMTPFYVNDKQASRYRSGSVFLAGDASHIHSPVGGQGMNTGMQDAANLGWKLAAVAHGANEGLLDSYHEERSAVGKALLEFTERGLKMATTPNRILESLRDTIVPLLTPLNFVQERALRFVSETAIEYRDSPIVEDFGGDGSLRAGDRMPDINISEEDDSNAETGLNQQSESPTLLRNWVDARHLVLLLNLTDEDSELVAPLLFQATSLRLHGNNLDDEGHEFLGTDKKVFVIRPDGYIGFRGPISKRQELKTYLVQMGLLVVQMEPKS